MSNGTTVGHVGPGEDMTTVCNQDEADTRIILHIIHALNCGFSSILIKTPFTLHGNIVGFAQATFSVAVPSGVMISRPCRT